MRRILVVALFTALVIPLAAQSSREQKRGWSTGGVAGNLFFGPGSSRHHGGFFPLLPIGRERAGSLFLTRFFFSNHRPTAAGLGSDFPLGGYPYYSPYSSSFYYPYGGLGASYGMPFFGYQGLEARPALYNSARFVEEWKDRDPRAERGSESQDSMLQQSILLKEGMDEEQVVQTVGSPLQRVQLGERTVWKFSGYSLLFEGGKLKEIR